MDVRESTAQLLLDAREGGRDAFDRLFSAVYEELRRIAHQRLLELRPGQTLGTTALVHEAYLRLVDDAGVTQRDRAHFLAIASRAMRFVIVDHARAGSAGKRGGGVPELSLEEFAAGPEEDALDVLAVHDALTRLERSDERLGRVVEHRIFGGLSHAEIAEITGASERTVKRDWERARLWLFHCLRQADERPSPRPATSGGTDGR